VNAKTGGPNVNFVPFFVTGRRAERGVGRCPR